MKCIYCKQGHPDNFIFCPMTGFRIGWDIDSITEEKEIQEYQNTLASSVPIGGKLHCIRGIFDIELREELKERKNVL